MSTCQRGRDREREVTIMYVTMSKVEKRGIVEIESPGRFASWNPPPSPPSGAARSNGTKRESFMQYTKASSSIYNRDKHVFPIRSACSPVAPARSDRDRFPQNSFQRRSNALSDIEVVNTCSWVPRLRDFSRLPVSLSRSNFEIVSGARGIFRNRRRHVWRWE